jgi:hypothetical protein
MSVPTAVSAAVSMGSGCVKRQVSREERQAGRAERDSAIRSDACGGSDSGAAGRMIVTDAGGTA